MGRVEALLDLVRGVDVLGQYDHNLIGKAHAESLPRISTIVICSNNAPDHPGNPSGIGHRFFR